MQKQGLVAHRNSSRARHQIEFIQVWCLGETGVLDQTSSDNYTTELLGQQ